MNRIVSAALTGLVAAVSLALPSIPHAQSFTGKTLRIIVPFAPGGTSDILARALSNKVGESLGATVVVDNKPGANGVLGSDLVAKSAPDGLTLLLTDVGGLTSAAPLGMKLPFDAGKDLAPVTMIAYSPHIAVVNPGVPAKTLSELVAASKTKAGGFSAATSGAGSAPHLAAALFAHRAGVNWVFVPYKGGAQAITDMIAGHAQVMFNGMLATLPPVKSGQLRVLAVSSEQRWPTLPDVPTVAESGFPGFVTGSWQGLMVAAATPKPIIDKLNAEFAKALAIPEVRERLVAQGAEPRPMSSSAFADFLKAETVKWTQLVKDTGIKAE
ncbi:MAG: tripartite tricarboxylate transporter substrate binding protein [Burkholderiales bacterium]|nr:tripartite tricarboxylate transporter substrate binding protein [Burkholderiales bacterium]